MAEITPIRDKTYFDALNEIYNQQRVLSHLKFVGNEVARFIKYLFAEDQLFCRVPEHPSYAGQKELINKLDALARQGESSF
ncbi:MAG: hypothetical protein ABSA83_22475 [Verrucomicrobiota bacterium]